MKKVVSSFLIIGCLISASSCVTRNYHDSWDEYPPVPFFYQYRVDKVSVIVDHVQENNIAQQLKIIAETYLKSQQKYNMENDKIIFLDITVEQRSFMQNVEMYNSIYVSCIAYDEKETIYAKENEYISGKMTFISVTEQRVIISRIIDRLLAKQEQRYKDIEIYEKEMSQVQ